MKSAVLDSEKEPEQIKNPAYSFCAAQQNCGIAYIKSYKLQ